MKRILLINVYSLISLFGYGQSSKETLVNCVDIDFNKKVNKMLSYSVDVISVPELHEQLNDYTLLDTREFDEYTVSRIPGALHFGYDKPNWTLLDDLDKDAPIVVYCSIGYRSEKIGEQLIKKGFTQVRNLYGSIFEWANQRKPLENPRGQNVMIVHGYNKRWSKWINNEEIEITY